MCLPRPLLLEPAIEERNKMTQRSLPALAVCLAVYNGTRWLPEQLDSILAQTDVTITVYVSVDQSTDGTEAWIDARAAQDARIVVLPHGRRFGGAAPNFFRLLLDVDFDGFDYVCFADQDDIWLPGKLARAHQVLVDGVADAYSSNITAFWPDGRELLVKKSQPQRRWDFLFEAAGPGCTYVMKRALALAIQARLHERWSDAQHIGLHDWFSYAFARANGYRWIIDERSGMLYRQHLDNQVGVNSGWKAIVFRSQKVLNGWGMTQAALIADLVGITTNPFVSRWLNGGRLGLLWLAVQAGQCRRRRRDRLLFAFSCLVLCVLGQPRR